MKRRLLNLLFLVAVVFIMSSTIVHAANWKGIYSEDFSADPGWTTDQPANFYWESETGTYFLRDYNAPPEGAPVPNRYTYKLMTPYRGESFKLEWDQQVMREDWSAGIPFGMFDQGLSILPLTGSASIYVIYGPGDMGQCIALNSHQDLTGSGEYSCGLPLEFSPAWYHNILVYDPQNRTIKLTVVKRGESTPFVELTMTNAPIITSDLKYLGSVRYPVCYSPYNIGLSCDPESRAEGRIDNVVLSVEDPFCKGNFDFDKDVDGTDASTFKSGFGRSALKNPCPPDGPAPVERTWQSPSYVNYDDGYFQKGVAYPTPRFTDNGNGTVTDNLTGLIWLKNANCFGTRTWDQAISDCNGLASGSCGLTDGSIAGEWRLPHRNELNSLVDIQYGGPALCNAVGTGPWSEGDPFTGVTLATPDQVPYFTSSTYSTFSGHAWIVDMNSGKVVPSLNNNPSKWENCYVWPVRGGH